MKINKIPCLINFSTEDYDDLIKAKVIIMHEGRNRNNTSFTNESMKDAEETLKNKPLLAYIRRDEDGIATDFGEHDTIQKIINTENGYEIITYYLERPIGLFPESCNIRYEEIDGVTHMVADCYLWRDYSNESILLLEDNDGTKDVSMEIELIDSNYNKNDKVLEINKFKFRAVTVLGSDVIQGMNGTCNLNVYSNNRYSNFVKEMNSKINKYKEEGDIVSKITEPVVNSNENPSEPNITEFGLSIENLTDQAYNQIATRTVTKIDWWEDEYQAREFWYRDLLPNDNVVIVESSDSYSYYGIPYSLDGDTITLDFDAKQEYISEWRVKTGGENTLTFDLDRDELKEVVLEKFNEKESEISRLTSQVEGLETFKKSIDDAKFVSEIEEVLSTFTLEEDEIKELKEKVLNREIDKNEFTKELYALEGMKYIKGMQNKNFSVREDKPLEVPIQKHETPKVKPYGGILE